jgi:glycosyltransferase involved in cell wall biosynthesis
MLRKPIPTIGIIDSWFREPHQGSGTAVAVNGLIAALRRKGYDVASLAPAGHGRSLTLSRFLFNLWVLPRLLLSRPDVLVGIDWDGWLYSQLRPSRPYVVSIKGVLADELLFENGFTRRLLRFQSVLERLNLRSAGRVITTSLYSKRRLSELYGLPPESIHVVPEGIDLAAWSKSLKRDPRPFRKSVTILCVAKQFPRKRIHILMESVNRLKVEFPKLRLRVVGDGPEHARLLRLAERYKLNGVLTGALPRAEDLVAEYARADIFCLPSVQEGFGIVFLEAMAAGLPIVAARAAAVPELVRHGVNGLLARPDDASDLTVQLRRLVLDSKLRRRLGQAGKRIVRQYDWKKTATRFENAIRTF